MRLLGPVGPNHGGASLVTEPQPPQSQKCGYGPVNSLSANCLTVFDNFVGLALKGLNFDQY